MPTPSLQTALTQRVWSSQADSSLSGNKDCQRKIVGRAGVGVDNIDIESAKKEILELMEYDYENGSYDGYEWDYNQLDEILIKYIGIDLYDTSYHLLSRL